MAALKDTATFFVEGSCSQFQRVLGLYPQALKLKAEAKTKKPEELIKLDNWYTDTLTTLLSCTLLYYTTVLVLIMYM